MKTQLVSPFALKTGDRILSNSGEVCEVTEATAAPRSLGGTLVARSQEFTPQVGDRYSVKYRKPNGEETGISGIYDGDTAFRKVVEEGGEEQPKRESVKLRFLHPNGKTMLFKIWEDRVEQFIRESVAQGWIELDPEGEDMQTLEKQPEVYAGNGFPLFPNGLVEVRMERNFYGEEQTLKLKLYGDQVEDYIRERAKAGWVLISRGDVEEIVDADVRDYRENRFGLQEPE